MNVPAVGSRELTCVKLRHLDLADMYRGESFQKPFPFCFRIFIVPLNDYSFGVCSVPCVSQPECSISKVELSLKKWKEIKSSTC